MILYSHTAIIKIVYYLLGLLYTNKTNLNVLNKDNKLAIEVINRVQLILKTWNENLWYVKRFKTLKMNLDLIVV